MASAPRDGTPIEIRNTYGVMPWYSLCAFDKNCFGMGPCWYNVKGDGGFMREGPSWQRWRPYAGAIEDYREPTGGLQNTQAYWDGAYPHLRPKRWYEFWRSA